MHPEICTKGPSFPNDIPEESMNTMPKTLET